MLKLTNHKKVKSVIQLFTLFTIYKIVNWNELFKSYT